MVILLENLLHEALLLKKKLNYGRYRASISVSR